MSDPDVRHARHALSKLEHLVVQEIFLTETAWHATSCFPRRRFRKTGMFTNTDRRVQLGRQALDPPGEAKQDLLDHPADRRRIGLEWSYEHLATFSPK